VAGRWKQRRKVAESEIRIFMRGDRVFHDKFGYGEVVNVEGHKLDVRFDHSDIKRVMDSFVEKA
jgi:DNA helicase-2/ATP-dependent DNA helicase PcrA